MLHHLSEAIIFTKLNQSSQMKCYLKSASVSFFLVYDISYISLMINYNPLEFHLLLEQREQKGVKVDALPGHTGDFIAVKPSMGFSVS